MLQAVNACMVLCRSYGNRTETSGTVTVSFDAEAVKGRHCLMIDDLVDSGLTLQTVKQQLLEAGAPAAVVLRWPGLLAGLAGLAGTLCHALPLSCPTSALQPRMCQTSAAAQRLLPCHPVLTTFLPAVTVPASTTSPPLSSTDTPGAASVKSVVLLDKKARRKVAYESDYVGFDCPNHWVAGMGMDTNQLFRSLDYVAVLKPEAIRRALEQ